MRYPVESILELLSAGMTIDDILADYEDLEREDILAALAFAARLTQIKRMQPLRQLLPAPLDETLGFGHYLKINDLNHPSPYP